MQAGSIDPTSSLDAVKRGRLPVGNAPRVAGSSSENSGDSSVGTRVETVSAVSIVSAVSATIDSRQEPQRSPVQEAALAHYEQSQAASLRLSSEAQRLALIPVDVLDADEIAELREQVDAAQLQLRAEMAGYQAAARKVRASTPPPSAEASTDAQRTAPASVAPPPSAPPSSRASSQAAQQVAVTQASNRAELAEALSLIQSARDSTGEKVSSVEKEEPRASSPRSSPMSALQGRSPFESSSPGATGQSIDIVVGEDAPASRVPG